MLIKRAILALCLLPFPFSLLSATIDLGAKGTLKFTLKINQRAYELIKDSVEVDMRLAVLKKPVGIGTELNPTTLSIGLKSCGKVVRAYTTMDETPDVDDPNLFTLDAGDVAGVRSKIKTSAGAQQFPKNMTPTPIELAINGDGAHQLSYIASHVPLRADATIGCADATVDFTVQYE